MADGRFLSRSVSQNDQLARVSIEAALLFTWCVPHLDIEGRMTGQAQLIHGQVCPLRPEISVLRIPMLLRELVRHELVIWYAVAGREYLAFPGFKRQQKGLRVDREKASTIPSPNGRGVQLLGVGDDPSQLSLVDNRAVIHSGNPPEDSGTPPPEVEVEVEGEVEVQGEVEVSLGGAAADTWQLLRGHLQGAGRAALEGYARAARQPAFLTLAIMAEGPDGIHAKPGVSYELLGQALVDMQACGTEFSPQILRAFLRKLLERPPAAPGRSLTDAERMRADAEQLERQGAA